MWHHLHWLVSNVISVWFLPANQCTFDKSSLSLYLVPLELLLLLSLECETDAFKSTFGRNFWANRRKEKDDRSDSWTVGTNSVTRTCYKVCLCSCGLCLLSLKSKFNTSLFQFCYKLRSHWICYRSSYKKDMNILFVNRKSLSIFYFDLVMWYLRFLTLND